VRTLFDKILSHYKPIESVTNANISYGKLGEHWGYVVMKDDDYDHYETQSEALKGYQQYLKEILKQIGKDMKTTKLEELPF
jgi:hypothetical protein